MQNTTLYLIRHSIKYDIKDIVENYNTSDSEQIKNEKLILSIEGERRAEILSNEKELQNIDTVYASVLVRTLETAKYLLEKQNLKINLDSRLDERRRGRPNDDIYPDWFTKQFLDENFKTLGGESQKDVRKRMDEVVSNVRKKLFVKKINNKVFNFYSVFYPIGNGSFNVDKSIEDIKWIISNMEEKYENSKR